MRIISGSARGKRLATFDGNSIRPTSDRVREALFSMLFSRLGNFSGQRVLDLYAGSGALSLEALSRGACHATLIDDGRQAANLIEHNASTCQLQDKISLIRGQVLDKLALTRNNAPFDLIFVDPPYDKGLLTPTLAKISELSLLAEDGIVCIELSSKESLPEHVGHLQCIAQRRYGASQVGLLTRCHCEESQT
ncbi:MAG: 16S rRNA (guanine(966)-N(2))-methyltransferase RsmD [Desulfuromonadales bacterium C00003094]|nr:MAG: 16S rRNA (guanine(966)-N(2))-methyltransferase RsmD [Desulfuromonadales bacterium C00003094]OEU73477.1 MAG: 16S rRNA (guanine(966)-N(2))-methyltransferase RsmD [Desulfuromonadales bacterium C00003107]